MAGGSGRVNGWWLSSPGFADGTLLYSSDDRDEPIHPGKPFSKTEISSPKWDPSGKPNLHYMGPDSPRLGAKASPWTFYSTVSATPHPPCPLQLLVKVPYLRSNISPSTSHLTKHTKVTEGNEQYQHLLLVREFSRALVVRSPSQLSAFVLPDYSQTNGQVPFFSPAYILYSHKKRRKLKRLTAFLASTFPPVPGILTPSRGRYILRKRLLPSMNIIGLSAAFVARVLACLEKEPSLPYGPSLSLPYLTSPSLRPFPDHAPLLLNTPDLHPAFLANSRLPSHCFLFIQPGPPFTQLAPSKYPFGYLSRSSLHKFFVPLAEPYPTSVAGDLPKGKKKTPNVDDHSPLSEHRPASARTQSALAGCLTGIARQIWSCAACNNLGSHAPFILPLTFPLSTYLSSLGNLSTIYSSTRYPSTRKRDHLSNLTLHTLPYPEAD
ncbi:uncharacterized protein CLUP02_06148 [Colletotrichum lupini]|uniref:Uncharacterized protein n=1 Tax=Colletotrichum lupini TaxID=145971 RepID=A0A9Q8WES2_9PEZI|nr:uncharacterized protein CLUP02_06148 [Colletotrichum lupini]UQC80664.1 hypothetical protein CLUP02_06148 [Colletotrichum lupini]